MLAETAAIFKHAKCLHKKTIYYVTSSPSIFYLATGGTFNLQFSRTSKNLFKFFKCPPNTLSTHCDTTYCQSHWQIPLSDVRNYPIQYSFCIYGIVRAISILSRKMVDVLAGVPCIHTQVAVGMDRFVVIHTYGSVWWITCVLVRIGGYYGPPVGFNP